MKIVKATYGGADCTAVINKRVINNSLRLKVSNSIIGDPLVGQVKYLEIEYIIKGETKTDKWREGDYCVIQEKQHKKLGIFYSNNNRPETQKTIISSLKSIEKAAEDKADILTCMWVPQADNPFQEFISWTHTYSHLNQLLQIMQLLYIARDTGEYESVSFLEHDVLYPEDYFDYALPASKEILCNMNYIGMNKNGFQNLDRQDQPFHQMTMRFNDAIEHCESILANALITNSGMIEPNWGRVTRQTKNSSVHVNHGHHFTSHYSIYSKSVKKTNEYWGNIKDYKDLFQ